MIPGEILLSFDEIQTRIRALGQQLSADYAGRNPLLICLLKGAFVFFADLIRHFTVPYEVDFITMSSYRNGLKRNARVEIYDHLSSRIEGRDIIVVEGIIDTGHTLNSLIEMISNRHITSLKVCTLLDKPNGREVPVPVDYVGFRIPDLFVVGYGLDYRERFRNLTDIVAIDAETTTEWEAPAQRGTVNGEGDEAAAIEPIYSTFASKSDRKEQ